MFFGLNVAIFVINFVDKKYNLQRYFPFIILYVASNLISDCKVSDSTLLGWKLDACCSVGILKNIVPSAIEYTSFFRRFFLRYLFGDKSWSTTDTNKLISQAVC